MEVPDSTYSRSNPSHPWVRFGIWLGWISTLLASLVWSVQQAYPAWRDPSDLTRLQQSWSLLQTFGAYVLPGVMGALACHALAGFLALRERTRTKQFHSLREVWRTESRREPVPPLHRRRAKPPLVPTSNSWHSEVPHDADPLA